jgi:hypothetical protein
MERLSSLMTSSSPRGRRQHAGGDHERGVDVGGHPLDAGGGVDCVTDASVLEPLA